MGGCYSQTCIINAEENAYDTPLEEEDNFEHEDYEHHQDRGEVEAQEGKSDDDRAEKDAFYSPALPTMVQSARRDDDQSSQASSTWGSTRSAPAAHATLSQSRLFSYCRHNRYLELQYHLHSGKDVNIRDRHGNTLLMIACQNNLRSMTKLLLRCGADMDLQNDKGNAALHYAFGYGYGQTLECISLEEGCGSPGAEYIRQRAWMASAAAKASWSSKRSCLFFHMKNKFYILNSPTYHVVLHAHVRITLFNKKTLFYAIIFYPASTDLESLLCKDAQFCGRLFFFRSFSLRFATSVASSSLWIPI